MFTDGRQTRYRRLNTHTRSIHHTYFTFGIVSIFNYAGVVPLRNHHAGDVADQIENAVPLIGGGVHHHPSRTHAARLSHQLLRTTSPSSFDPLYGGRCLAAHGYCRFPILYQPADIWIRVHGSTPGGCTSPHATSCCRVSRFNLRESAYPTRPCLLGE